MKFLHYNLDLGDGDVVVVQLDKQANVRLLDPINFQNFRAGRRHQFVGGRALVSPFRIPAPEAGQWYLVIDLGGYAGHVRASVSVARA